MTETWRPVVGWEGFYEVSDQGQVRSVPRPKCSGRILRAHPNQKGYLIVVFSGAGKRRAFAVHRLVAEAFIGPIPDGWHTCHIDGNTENNSAPNLRYATPSENNRDIIRHGRNANVNKTHCPQGHPYTEGNLAATNRGRKCLTCHRERTRKYRAAKKRAA